MTCPYKRQKSEISHTYTHITQRRPCEDEGRDWSSAEACSCQITDFRLLVSRDVREKKSVVLSHEFHDNLLWQI